MILMFVIDDDQNQPLASDGEEDHFPVRTEPSKLCLTEDPIDCPESSETVTEGRFLY
jgi:hypothetical protein